MDHYWSKYNALTSPLLKHMEILSVTDMLHQQLKHFIINVWIKSPVLLWFIWPHNARMASQLQYWTTQLSELEQNSDQNDWQVPKKLLTRAIKLCTTYRLK